MGKKTMKGIAFLLIIAMMAVMMPAMAFAEGEGTDGGSGTQDVDYNNEEVLKSVSYESSETGKLMGSISGKDITFTVPYSFGDGVLNLSETAFQAESGYDAVTLVDFSSDNISVGQESEMTLRYKKSGNETFWTTTYLIHVEQKEYNKPTFANSISVTGNVSTGYTFTQKDFLDAYTQNDGGSISKIVITSETRNGIKLLLNGAEYQKNTDIAFDQISSGRLKFTAEKAASIDCTFDVYHKKDGTDEEVVKNDVVLKLNAVAQTSIGDVTASVKQNATVKFPAADVKSKAGVDLSYVKFTSLPSSSYGTLYYKYVSTSNKGTPVDKTTQYNYSGNTNPITDLTFLAGSSTGTATYGYEAYDANGTKYTGSVKFSVTATGTTTVTYNVNQDKTVSLRASNFNTACSNSSVGGTLDYITFSSTPSTSYGTLYYDYTSSSKPGTKVSTGKKYYSSGSPGISNITFVPKSTYDGTVNVSYTGYNTSGKSFTGTVKFVVKDTDSDIATITYDTEKDKVVEFSGSTFNSKFRSAAGSGTTLDYVKFDIPSTSEGVLYEGYKSSSNKGDKITSSTKCYYKGSSSQTDLDDITFVPKSGRTSTVTINYTAYGDDDDVLEGKVKITFDGSDTDIPTIKLSTGKGEKITFSASTFNTKFKDEVGVNLDYVKFTSFPTSSQGTLYYNYTSSSNSDKITSSSTKYYRSASSSQKSLGKVTFVPKSTYEGTLTLKYTGYDEDDEDSYTGQVQIKVGSGSSSSGDGDLDVLTYSIKSTDTLPMPSSNINTMFKKEDGDNFDYVKFTTLPSSSAGKLVLNYNSSTGTGTTVTSSAKYYRTGDTPLLSSVSFVPNATFSSTVNINYTAYDSDGDSYDGVIRVTVQVAAASKYFNDVTQDYKWAATEIDYLYGKNVITGTSSSKYSPAANIKRGDFILMLYRAFNLTSKKTASFSDVPSGSYYYTAICTAKALDIAQGANNKFNPEGRLTRQDAMALVYRTLEVTGKKLTPGTAQDLAQFSDRSLISQYAYTPVATLVKAGIIKGSTDSSGKYRLNPRANMTRAEMAVVLYRVLVEL